LLQEFLQRARGDEPPAEDAFPPEGPQPS